MDKKLIALFVPAVGETFELLVPTRLALSELTALLVRGVGELCQGHYVLSGQETLSLRQGTAPLEPVRTLEDYGVEDGAQLILV